MFTDMPIRKECMVNKKVSRAALGALFFLFSLSFSGKPEKIDGLVAVVGDEIVLQSELDAYTALRLSGLDLKPDSAELPAYRKKFLDELIDGKVLLVHAKNDTTMSVTSDEVERSLENQITMILQRNNLSIDSLETILLHEQGITLAKFKADSRTNIREQLLKQKVQRQYLSSIKVSRRDVEDFYKQYRDSLPKAGESVLLSKLAITVTPAASVRQAAWEKMLSIKKRLTEGADFAEMAQRFSESPEGAFGGDLGFIEKGTLNLLAFEQKAFSLPQGQTSDPFETPLGFHIINVLARENQKVHVRQIFIRVAPSPEQINKISALLDSVRENRTTAAGFIAAVRNYSTDKNSKTRDGSLGWKSVLNLPAPVRAAIDTLRPGTVTPVVNDAGELSVYRIDDRASERPLTLEDDWQVLAEKAQDIMAQKKLIDLVSRWRHQVYISIRM